jgi:hypothetical protein
MAEAAREHSAFYSPVDTLDALFQILITRDRPYAVMAKILQALQFGELLIDSHVAEGARKSRPMRHATAEELRAAQNGHSLDFLCEAAPAGGITERVNPQSWGRVLTLAIRDDHLVVEPLCGFDFPWQAYTFTIANPVAVPHLFGLAAPAITAQERPRPGASKIDFAEWALRQLRADGVLDALHGDKLIEAVRAKVDPRFTVSMRNVRTAMQRPRNDRN